MTNMVDDFLVYNILRNNSEYFYDKMIVDEHGNEYYLPPINKVSGDIELTFRMINNEIVPFVGSESNISPWLVNNIIDWFRCELLRRFKIIHQVNNYRHFNDKEIQAINILSDSSNNDARVMFILCTDANYFHDKMIADERGNNYYIPPRDTELTFRLIINEIFPIIGNGTNISTLLFYHVMKLFSIELRRRFNLLRMSISDIVKYLGRPLNDKEILAKNEVDGYNNR